MMLHLPLRGLEDTAALALRLARAIEEHGPVCLLLQGPLGSGKTTLTRFLIQALPGGDQALVSSPSFNLVNVYPTRPEAAHIDLYRLGDIGIDEDILDIVHEQNRLVIVEWADHLDQGCRPEDHLLGSMAVDPHEGRSMDLSARGDRSAGVIDMISRCLTSEEEYCQRKEPIVR